MRTRLWNPPGQPGSWTVELYTLSEDYYRYLRSRRTIFGWDGDIENPFAEPVPIHTNVENDHPRPPMKAEFGGNPDAPPAIGAAHSAEIEYALGNLDVNPIYHWRQVDYQVSDLLLKGYFVNFIKTGDPNGKALPRWPASGPGDDIATLHIAEETKAVPPRHTSRYLLLDRLSAEQAP